LNDYTIDHGFYVMQEGMGMLDIMMGDIYGRMGGTLPLDETIRAEYWATLQRLNNVLSGGFNVGGLVYLPTADGSTLSIGATPINLSEPGFVLSGDGAVYVIDPATGKVYTFGSWMNGYNGGGLMVTPNDPEERGGALFRAGTYGEVNTENGDTTVRLLDGEGNLSGYATIDSLGRLHLSTDAFSERILPSAENLVVSHDTTGRVTLTSSLSNGVNWLGTINPDDTVTLGYEIGTTRVMGGYTAANDNDAFQEIAKIAICA
jgi:hypothetical protein